MSEFIENSRNRGDCIKELPAKRKGRSVYNSQLPEDFFKDIESQPLYMSSSLLDFSIQDYIERKFVEISEREQRRIGQDLHDSIGQILTGIAFISKVLEQKLTAKLAVEADQAAIITKLVSEAINSTRSLVRTLNPVRLEADGLILALQELGENIKKTFGVSCMIRSNQPVFIYDNIMATHLYRIVQEAINNAIRHGKAKNINIDIKSSHQKLIMTVKDDGVGFPPVLETKRGMGLNIMKYRARMIRASLSICEGTDSGVIVKCIVKQNLKDKAKELYETRIQS